MAEQLTKEQEAIVRLRVELYGAAQILKGTDLADFKQLISEIAMVLDIVPLGAQAGGG